MLSCNNGALFERVERALRRNTLLRRSTADLRTILTGQSARATVMPVCHGASSGVREQAVCMVAIVFSAGGLQALIHVLHGLPADFPAAIGVANHMGDASCLAELLRNQTVLDVKLAEAGDVLYAGTVYVCPPRRHLVINPDATISLSSRAPVRRARPSADWFLKTVAGTFGDRAIGVILSGASSDGAEGARLIGQVGGKVIVQEPATCAFSLMPAAAIRCGVHCTVTPPDEIAGAIIAAHASRDMRQARAEWEEPFGPLEAA
jgi:two-component system chemotaxis response regulator CheB